MSEQHTNNHTSNIDCTRGSKHDYTFSFVWRSLIYNKSARNNRFSAAVLHVYLLYMAYLSSSCRENGKYFAVGGSLFLTVMSGSRILPEKGIKQVGWRKETGGTNFWGPIIEVWKAASWRWVILGKQPANALPSQSVIFFRKTKLGCQQKKMGTGGEVADPKGRDRRCVS